MKKQWIFGVLALNFIGCVALDPPPTIEKPQAPSLVSVRLPYLRLANGVECYYVDDFMPTPDSLVTGKASRLYLRYYTYDMADYKSWSDVGVMLSFYSIDLRCWYLFEEYILHPVVEGGDLPSVSQSL